MYNFAFSEEKEHLGDVWGYDISELDEVPHLPYHFFCHAFVELAIVAQDGIDNDEVVGATEILDQLGDDLHLLGRAEVAGVEGVELEALGLPVGDDFTHLGS